MLARACADIMDFSIRCVMAVSAERSRIVLLAGVIAGLLALDAAVLPGLWRDSVQAGVTRVFADLGGGGEADVSGVTPRTVELATETARRVRGAVKQRDYATADKLAADVLASSRMEYWRFYPFSDFIKGIADLYDPQFESDLNDWVAHDSGAAMPLLVRAEFYEELAREKRGTGFISETSSENLAAFSRYLQMAFTDASAAAQRDPRNPYAVYLELITAGGGGLTGTALNVFKDGIEKYPDYYPLYEYVLDRLQPKWGGTVDAMYGFVEQHADGTGERSQLKLLYVSLYAKLLETAWTACYGKEKDDLANCISAQTRDLVRPELERELPPALALYDHTNKYQFGVEIEEIFSDVLQWDSAGTYAGVILELIAVSMHSSAELMDVPGQNDYIVDKLVAKSWLQKAFYDNALHKAKEALQDIKNTAFPDEAAKDLAVAGVLETIALVDDDLGEYRDMIANEEQAVTLGDKIVEERYICSRYYTIRDYAASIRACTQAMDDGANPIEARFWRGMAYRDSGDADAAVKDWTIVAGLNSRYRSNAVIDMSMIYFGRNDYRGALDVLKKYDFLYDPGQSDKESVAIGYNNRCYAYMQLGQLKEALSDCTESLKYGSIPDAYDKQLKLMKRLNMPTPVL